MSEGATERVYLRMLEAVGARAGDIGPGIFAAHWPFVGSDYQGLVVVNALVGDVPTQDVEIVPVVQGVGLKARWPCGLPR